MRIALFAPYLPAPVISGGRIRIHHLTRGLVELGDIVLFAAAAQRELRDPAAREALNLFSGVHIALNPWGYVPTLRHPRRVVRASARRLRVALAEEHARAPFDVAVVEHVHAGKLAVNAGLPIVLDEHNIESRYLREQDLAFGRTGLSARIEHGRFERWERRLWRKSQAVVCVSEQDAAVVSKAAPKTPVDVVANGVDTHAIRFEVPSERGSKEILFVALMNHPPNVEAALRLAHTVMPSVWQTQPDARLVLCGHNPAPEVRALASERVEVTGSVPSVSAYLDRAAVVVNPLRHGAGTSLKVLEALACGAPLVTTHIGVRGYPAGIHEVCSIADTDESMAAAILECLRAPGALDERSRLGRERAQDYDWTQLARRFREIVARVGAGSRTKDHR